MALVSLCGCSKGPTGSDVGPSPVGLRGVVSSDMWAAVTDGLPAVSSPWWACACNQWRLPGPEKHVARGARDSPAQRLRQAPRWPVRLASAPVAVICCKLPLWLLFTFLWQRHGYVMIPHCCRHLYFPCYWVNNTVGWGLPVIWCLVFACVRVLCVPYCYVVCVRCVIAVG